MNDQVQEVNAGESMVLGLIDQADKLQKNTLAIQKIFLQEAQQFSQFAKSTETLLARMRGEAERLQMAQANIERSAAAAIKAAIQQQGGEIQRQTQQALVSPLKDISQAAGRVRQNARDSSWMLLAGVLIAGIMLGLFAGYYFVIHSQNSIKDRLDGIEQILSTPQQSPK